MKNKKWRLRVLRQPATEFYKDEGGKHHALEVVVGLEAVDGSGLPRRFRAGDAVLPLRVELFYESEDRVEDSDQSILRTMATDPKSMWVQADDRSCVIRFRIEKVSRRKDGKKFKVLVAPEEGETPVEFQGMEAVMTTPICVMSKRKAGASGRSRSRRRGSVSGDADYARPDPAVARKLAALEEHVTLLTAALDSQAQRIRALESAAEARDASAAMAATAATARLAPPNSSPHNGNNGLDGGTDTLQSASASSASAAAARAPGSFLEGVLARAVQPQASPSPSPGPSPRSGEVAHGVSFGFNGSLRSPTRDGPSRTTRASLRREQLQHDRAPPTQRQRGHHLRSAAAAAHAHAHAHAHGQFTVPKTEGSSSLVASRNPLTALPGASRSTSTGAATGSAFHREAMDLVIADPDRDTPRGDPSPVELNDEDMRGVLVLSRSGSRIGSPVDAWPPSLCSPRSDGPAAAGSGLQSLSTQSRAGPASPAGRQPRARTVARATSDLATAAAGAAADTVEAVVAGTGGPNDTADQFTALKGLSVAARAASAEMDVQAPRASGAGSFAAAAQRQRDSGTTVEAGFPRRSRRRRRQHAVVSGESAAETEPRHLVTSSEAEEEGKKRTRVASAAVAQFDAGTSQSSEGQAERVVSSTPDGLSLGSQHSGHAVASRTYSTAAGVMQTSLVPVGTAPWPGRFSEAPGRPTASTSHQPTSSTPPQHDDSSSV